MTRSEFVGEVADRAQLSRQEAARAVAAMIDTVTETLGAGGVVSLTGFGRFQAAERGGRRAVNPRTGEVIQIPTVRVARFVAGSELKRTVRARPSDPDG